jgi:hypothetical protein
MRPSTGLIYDCPASAIWAKDASHLVVVNQAEGVSWRLDGVAARIWELLALGYSSEKVCRMLAVVEGMTTQETVSLLNRTVQAWQVAGIVSLAEIAEADDG